MQRKNHYAFIPIPALDVAGRCFVYISYMAVEGREGAQSADQWDKDPRLHVNRKVLKVAIINSNSKL
jgi:hypothetical protein